MVSLRIAAADVEKDMLVVSQNWNVVGSAPAFQLVSGAMSGFDGHCQS